MRRNTKVRLTGHGDIPMTVKAMRAGAVEFLTKPFREQDLLDAVRAALQRDRIRRQREDEERDLRSRFDTLSARERKVVALVTAGSMNKQVAAELGVSEVTVKVHRHNVMQKLGVRSLADLVRIADLLGVTAKKWPPRRTHHPLEKTSHPSPGHLRRALADATYLRHEHKHRASTACYAMTSGYKIRLSRRPIGGILQV
jgi:DNA-binding CsgD family transcriptional regulator